jgi:oligosaccharide repeat unit polymerase
VTAGVRLFKKRGKECFSRLEWGDFFSPWCLTVVIWLGDIVLYFLQGTLDPIGPEFLTCFALWLATFIPCSLLAFWLSKDDSVKILPDHKKPIDANLYGFYGLTALSLMMTLLYAKAIYGIVSQFDMENMLYNIRVLAVANTENFGLLNYTQGINLGLFLVAIWLYPRISKWMVALIVVINLILELAMMEKSGILIMILGTLFVLYERRVIRVRTIGLTFVCIVILFFFFNMSKEDADSEESMTFMDFFGMYVTSPMVAFERLKITICDTFAANTLNDFYPQLQRFGINIESIGRLQDFVFVPIPTNVYTIMQPFYNDFGRTGVAFFGFLYGSLFGYVYRKFYEGDDMYKCFYTYLVEVIIIQFYNENLLQVFHLVLEASIVIFLLTRLNKLCLAPMPIQIAQHEEVQD